MSTSLLAWSRCSSSEQFSSFFYTAVHWRNLSNILFSRDLKEPLISEGLLMKLSTFVEVNKVLIWNLVTQVFWCIVPQ